MADEWKDIMSQAKDLAKKVSQATKEELERAGRETERALSRAATEVEKKGLELRKRILDSTRVSREPLLLDKEVITSDGMSLGKVKNVRLDPESKVAWLVVGKAAGEPKSIAISDVQAVGDKITLSLAEGEIVLKEEV
jgi:sporulation protein YlmC with PRC-barrel domain